MRLKGRGVLVSQRGMLSKFHGSTQRSPCFSKKEGLSLEIVSQQYCIERSCAAHCTYQGSNKDWVGILVHVISAEADPTATEAPDATTWMFLSVYGKSGANLQGGGLAPLTTRR